MEDKIDYRQPVYLQLREIVRNRIEEGEYLPGTAIPSENTLATTYGINRLTVRNAVDALVHEGVLQRVQGKGVFVVGHRYEEQLDSSGGFVEEMNTAGSKRSSVKELVKMLRPAGNKYANYFDMDPNGLIVYAKNFITNNNDPLTIQEIFVPQDVLPEMETVNSSVFTLREIFSFYGIRLGSLQQTMEVVNEQPKIQKLLDVPEGVAIVELTCEYRDNNGRIIAMTKSYIRSDKCTFRIRMR